MFCGTCCPEACLRASLCACRPHVQSSLTNGALQFVKSLWCYPRSRGQQAGRTLHLLARRERQPSIKVPQNWQAHTRPWLFEGPVSPPASLRVNSQSQAEGFAQPHWYPGHALPHSPPYLMPPSAAQGWPWLWRPERLLTALSLVWFLVCRDKDHGPRAGSELQGKGCCPLSQAHGTGLASCPLSTCHLTDCWVAWQPQGPLVGQLLSTDPAVCSRQCLG